MEANGSSRYVDLNVGGTYYTTSLSTLTSYPDSLLYKIFSKTTIPLDKDRKGRYIIDRDGKVFRYILNFLRGGNLNLHEDFKEYDQLREEVTYYKLKDMKSLLNKWQTGKNKRISLEQHNENNGTEGRRKDITPEMLDLDPDSVDIDYQSDMEMPDECDAPAWFMDTNCHRTPYVPQVGDEVMYFWQGHKCYVDAVKSQCVYDIDGTKFPWERGDLKTEETMRVISLEYHTGPPITCEIKVACIDHVTKKPAGKTFQFRYHVMPEIKDFMILTQHYEISMKRKWKVEDQFRAVIGNKWWLGVIKDITPIDKEFPESLFQSFSVRWDNGKSDVLSSWDLEPIERKNSLIKAGKRAQITNEEMQQLRYNPKTGDWGEGDQNTECDRILACLDQIMSLEVAKILTSPIDRSDDSDESIVAPYPIKLDTVKKRLERRFYRRRLALQWEVRQIETNANLFNEPNSEVVKSAELVTNILLEVVRNVKVDNAVDLHNRMVGINDMEQEREGKGEKRSRRVKKISSSEEESDDETKTPPKKRRSTRTHDETLWVKECKNLLNVLFTLEDSKHFRSAIEESIFKDYADVIEEPMDLTTVKERMNSGEYEDPHEFAKDIRLIVSNSKACFTDKKKKIYTMTREFSKVFEDNIRETLMNYKNAAAYKKLDKGYGTPSSIKNEKDQKQDSREKLTPPDKSGPSGIQKKSKARQDRSYTSQSQAKEDEDDSDRETVCSLAVLSDEEWLQCASDDLSGTDEDDSAAKTRNRTPTAKSPKKKVGLKAKGKDKSGKTTKQTKHRKSSSSSDDSLFEVDF